MLSFQEIKNSFWRVPLIAIIAGFLYIPCYVWIVIRFGVIEPGVIDDIVGLLASGFLLLSTLILGWLILLRNLTRTELFISSSIVVVYGLLLYIVQVIFTITTGPGAVVVMYLSMPLQWMTLPSEIGLYLQKHYTITIPFLGFFYYFVPWLFIVFGRKNSVKLSKQ